MMETNGEVRMKVFDGSGKSIYRFVFAGPAHIGFNGGGVSEEHTSRSENTEFIAQQTERNKIIGREKKNEKGRNE